MIRLWLLIAGLGGAASVVAGAAAAHLADQPATATLLNNGALYGMIHAAALLAIIGFAQGREPRRGAAAVAGWVLRAGHRAVQFRAVRPRRDRARAIRLWGAIRRDGVHPRLALRRDSCLPPALNL